MAVVRDVHAHSCDAAVEEAVRARDRARAAAALHCGDERNVRTKSSAPATVAAGDDEA